MMEANDRGTKKWTALMLTEHQEALRKLFDQKRVQREANFGGGSDS
ncbi:hypothetical protein RWE15_14660 [Virgibacillus halophilus]|uniref:Uncharacterized protein n=1 Tax=Tigheibacillus halophilus TaxID=361280 RepID=A0ABU5C803_9BACI|nr:hypothetical protein [Virgibacillus halophilus]